MRKWISLVVLSAFASFACVAAVGCGGTETADSESVEDTTAGNEDPMVEDDPVVVDEPPPTRSGPGQLTVSNRVGNEDGGGTVQVLSTSGEVVAEGASGQTFNVDSGTYMLRGSITDDSILIDTPTRDYDGTIEVPAGETTTQEIVFPRSRVLLRIRRGSRNVRTWSLAITRDQIDGAEEVTLTPSTTHVPITPGRYSGMLTHGRGQQVEVSGLIFQGGATMTVPVNIN